MVSVGTGTWGLDMLVVTLECTVVVAGGVWCGRWELGPEVVGPALEHTADVAVIFAMVFSSVLEHAAPRSRPRLWSGAK